MKEQITQDILTLLSTMPGFPRWERMTADGEISPIALTYAAFLNKIEDDKTGHEICANVCEKFAQRPSVYELRQWAIEIRQKAVQAPGYLMPALTVSATPGTAMLEAATGAGRETVKKGGKIPEEARAIFRDIKRRMAEDARKSSRLDDGKKITGSSDEIKCAYVKAFGSAGMRSYRERDEKLENEELEEAA